MAHDDVVSIVGGGWSFAEVDHKKVPGTVILVNDSLVYWKGEPAKHVVSMDRLWTENRWHAVQQAGILDRAHIWIRKAALKRITGWRENKLNGTWAWLLPFDNDNSGEVPFSEMLEQLNGANSGECAFNLAYLLQPRTLFAFGFDMNLSPRGQAYWYPPYPWAHKTGRGYSTWPKHFAQYRKQFDAIGCRVFNVSPTSAINAFEKVSARDIGVKA